jgi:RHS repeat-associated protein
VARSLERARWVLTLSEGALVSLLRPGDIGTMQAQTSTRTLDTTTTTPQVCLFSAAFAMPLHSTGKERDAESGNDYFEARYYSSAMGRFMSPDWSAKEDPVPYANLEDPQSLNLYAYVRNNPLARTDPDGHCCEDVLPAVLMGAEAAGGTIAGFTGGLVVLGGAALGAAGYSVSQGNSPYLTNGYPTSFNLNPTSENASASTNASSTQTSGQQSTPAQPPEDQSSGGRSKNDVKPDPNASGAHSVPKKDSNGNTVGYTTFNDKGGAVKRVDVKGGAHGGVETPHVHEPKPGKGPGAPLRHVRPARPDELPH